MDVTIGLALIAGIVSFISPCVLPLVPAYIGYLSGRVTNTVSSQVMVGTAGTAVMTSPTLAMRFSTLLHGIAFVFGFTFIFVTFGILITALAGTLNVTVVSGVIGRLGGVMIVFFGLHFMGVMPSIFSRIRRQQSPLFFTALVIGLAVAALVVAFWGFTGQLDIWNSRYWSGTNVWAPVLGSVTALLALLVLFLGNAFTDPRTFILNLINRLDMLLYADTRREMNPVGSGLTSSVLMGVVFSAGWTPCIGPIYGAILTTAAQTGDAGYALPLLTAYSLGLGIPFILSALLIDSAQGLLRRLNKHMQTIKLVTGGLLVFIGVAIASGNLQDFSQQLSNRFADVSIRVEECVVGWAEGDIQFGQVGTCLNGDVTFDELRELNGIPADPEA